MKCTKCNNEIKEGEKFCESCGTKTEYADISYGKITFKRKSSFYGCAIPFSIFIDGKSKGSIQNGGTLTFDIPYGTHKISINKANDKENREITINDEKKEITITVKTKIFALSFIAKGKIISVE